MPENGKDKHERAIEYVEIELDRPRRLLLNHNACALVERTLARMYGEWNPLPKILARVRLGGITETIAVLWAALRHEDMELTQERAGELLDAVPLEYVIERLSESVEKHFPVKQKTEPGEVSEADPTDTSPSRPTG